jgi:hypothetical protein
MDNINNGTQGIVTANGENIVGINVENAKNIYVYCRSERTKNIEGHEEVISEERAVLAGLENGLSTANLFLIHTFLIMVLCFEVQFWIQCRLVNTGNLTWYAFLIMLYACLTARLIRFVASDDNKYWVALDRLTCFYLEIDKRKYISWKKRNSLRTEIKVQQERILLLSSKFATS